MKINQIMKRSGENRACQGAMHISALLVALMISSSFSTRAAVEDVMTIPARSSIVMAHHDQISFSGKVVDVAGRAIPGVSIAIKGKNIKTLTSSSGEFTINAQSSDELEISHLSYQTKIITVGSNRNLTIVLEDLNAAIEEVTITGYTNYSKGKSPSSSAIVRAEDINQVPMSSLDQILQGKVAGMSVISSSGQPGQSAAVVIRGIGSISGSNTPLYVMDGIPIEGGYFQTINPQDIESVNVLKDASAKTLYGSRGSNGVIIITTKKGKQGRLAVHYSSQYGTSTLTRPNFEMMDGRERLRFEEEVGLETGKDIGPGWRYSSRNPYYATQSTSWQQNAEHIIDSLRQVNTDWRDLFFQNANFLEQQVNLSGGNENVQTYNALNYDENKIYLSETNLGNIKRANLDGTEVETVRSGVSNPRGMFNKTLI